jgi:hypothetical protein
MARPSDVQRQYSRVLDKARELSQQVRETAERVHQQALEAHRLTEIAREHSARGQELSRKGREEARAVERSLRWSLDTANSPVHGLSRKGKG